MTDWRNDILKEDSFCSLLRAAKRRINYRENRMISAGVFLVLFAIGFGRYSLGYDLVNYFYVLRWISEISELGVIISASTIGFLIAGFSIFATMTNKEVLQKLATVPFDKDENDCDGFSQLNFILSNFMVVFSHFIVFLSLSIFCGIVSTQNGMIDWVVCEFSNGNSSSWGAAANFLVVLLISYMVFILLLLKSFIWNIYQSVLLAIVLDGLDQETTDE